MNISFKEAKEAWGSTDTTAKKWGLLDAYFAQEPQDACPCPRTDCPKPAYYGGDEYRCLECGKIWGIREDKPDCYFKKESK